MNGNAKDWLSPSQPSCIRKILELLSKPGGVPPEFLIHAITVAEHRRSSLRPRISSPTCAW
jgi:hypothetical protein